MRQTLILFIIFLLTCTYIKCKKNIFGDSLIASGASSNYSISVKSVIVEWQIMPKEFGTIISTEDNHITVQWTSFPGKVNETRKCSLVAMVLYPNADYAYNYLKTITLKAFDTLELANRGEKGKFSKTSSDNIRFYYEIKCSKSIDTRPIRIIDSSFGSLQRVPSYWLVKNIQNKTETLSEGAVLELNLKPGKYFINLSKNRIDKKVNLSDTITVTEIPLPSFSISTQNPCEETTVLFTNTSNNSGSELLSTFFFGNGEFQILSRGQKLLFYSYSKNDLPGMVLLSKIEMTDLHGCKFSSPEIAIAPQQNLFTPFNAMIEPQRAQLKSANDKVVVKFSKGNSLAPGNPNVPFTYQWNTGQKTPEISLNYQGEFTLIVTDKYGCKTRRLGPVKITQGFPSKSKPALSGPAEIKASLGATYSITPTQDMIYQFKFIFNGTQSLVTEPSDDSKCALPDYEKSKPGELSVIGIILTKTGSTYYSSFSDTLRVQIVP